MPSFRYYWEYLKRFGKESSETWWKDFMAAAVLAIIPVFLAWGDRTVLQGAFLAVEAIGILFGLVALRHLFHISLILFRERAHPEYGGIRHTRWGYGVWPPAVTTDISPQKPQIVQSQPQTAPATFLDRIVLENRGLTPDDRNRLSTELYECDQFLKQSRENGYKLNTEFGKLSNDRQSGALAKNVDDHIKFLQELDKPAWDQYHGLQKLQAKWEYFPDQTAYVFSGSSGDAFNAGIGLLVNVVEGTTGALTSWSKISNRDQKDVLNIEAQQQADYEKGLRQFFDWVNTSLQRIKQMRQSLDPNGVVEPLPVNSVAPAAAVFSSN